MSKVLLGMSGGVDSSISVHLLQKMGHEVIGIYFKLSPESARDESGESDARKVADFFGIPFYVADERTLFSEAIIDSFAKAYAEGRTPNPCVYCNAQVKFHLLFHYAKRLACEKVATGHYAKIIQEEGFYYLAKGKDPKKDQSYFLSQLPQGYLPYILFPLGEYTKEEIRTLATTLDLPISQKKDSQEICFIPDDDYIRFLETHHHDKLPQKGIFCDQGGTILGQHHGAYHYTIGQRKGLGLALGYPAYVTGIDSAKGIVTIGRDEDLWHDSLTATEAKSFGNIPTSGSAIAKIRSRDMGTLADYHYHEDKLYVTFKEKVRAITPGQSVVLYDGEKLIGSGIIEKKPY